MKEYTRTISWKF